MFYLLLLNGLSQKNQRHNITEDTWRQVLAFSRCVHEDLEGYDPEGIISLFPYLTWFHCVQVLKHVLGGSWLGFDVFWVVWYCVVDFYVAYLFFGLVLLCYPCYALFLQLQILFSSYFSALVKIWICIQKDLLALRHDLIVFFIDH